MGGTSISCNLPRKRENGNQFSSQSLGILEPLRKEDDLCYQFIVGPRHGHWPEQLFQIVWQFLSTTIALASRVESDEYSRVGI